MLSTVCTIAAALVIGCGSAHAHHGAAAYDLERDTTLNATVIDFEWRNPHALLHFDATDESGWTVRWTAETAGLVILVRAGWTRDVLKPGDRVTIVGRRAKNGTATMLLQRVVLPSGRELTSFVPSVSGVWMRQQPGHSFSDAPPPPMTAAGAARFKANRPTVGPAAALDANDPTLECAPPGIPYVLTIPTPFEFVHVPGEVIQLFEYNHFVRRIHTDGRSHPADLRQTGMYEWLGHSIGRWEDDTFVIDTVGFNDATWLDRLGRPHSDRLRVVERIRRVNHDTLDYQVTVDDPLVYAMPWTGRMTFRLRPDWDILEHVCTTKSDAYLEFKQKAWEPVH